jgi:hypothetical protein
VLKNSLNYVRTCGDIYIAYVLMFSVIPPFSPIFQLNCAIHQCFNTYTMNICMIIITMDLRFFPNCWFCRLRYWWSCHLTLCTTKEPDRGILPEIVFFLVWSVYYLLRLHYSHTTDTIGGWINQKSKNITAIPNKTRIAPAILGHRRPLDFHPRSSTCCIYV